MSLVVAPKLSLAKTLINEVSTLKANVNSCSTEKEAAHFLADFKDTIQSAEEATGALANGFLDAVGANPNLDHEKLMSMVDSDGWCRKKSDWWNSTRNKKKKAAERVAAAWGDDMQQLQCQVPNRAEKWGLALAQLAEVTAETDDHDGFQRRASLNHALARRLLQRTSRREPHINQRDLVYAKRVKGEWDLTGDFPETLDDDQMQQFGLWNDGTGLLVPKEALVMQGNVEEIAVDATVIGVQRTICWFSGNSYTKK
jgi:hypothetical protein